MGKEKPAGDFRRALCLVPVNGIVRYCLPRCIFFSCSVDRFQIIGRGYIVRDEALHDFQQERQFRIRQTINHAIKFCSNR